MRSLRGIEFDEVRSVELPEQSLHVGDGGRALAFEMLGHTGVLTVTRKVGRRRPRPPGRSRDPQGRLGWRIPLVGIRLVHNSQGRESRCDDWRMMPVCSSTSSWVSRPRYRGSYASPGTISIVPTVVGFLRSANRPAVRCLASSDPPDLFDAIRPRMRHQTLVPVIDDGPEPLQRFPNDRNGA